MYKYNIDTTIFEKIDTPFKAYFLGLLFADGNSSSDGYTISISLKESDSHLLDEIKERLNYDRPLMRKETTLNSKKFISYALCFNSKKIVKDFLSHGLIPNKTFTLKFPNISDGLIHHFIRGYFDGDGCITGTNSEPRIRIIGNVSFLESIQEILENKLGFKKSKLVLEKRTKNPDLVKILNISGRKQCIKLRDWLYKDSDICLYRKKQKMYNIVPS